jgi:AraC-like DNA-binding protein
MVADVLSDVLRAVRLTGAVYFDFDATSPWVAEAPPSREIAHIVMPGAERVIEYHVIVTGGAWGHAVGAEPMRLREGDVLIFPHGDAHVLSSAPGLRAAPNLASYVRGGTPLPLMYELGGRGPERSRIICGFLGFDEKPYNPLLQALPRVIHLPSAGPHGSSGWLGTLVHITMTESGRVRRPGGENVLARLSELMFVEAVRRYVESLPEGQTGWLAGLTDTVVGHALGAIHGDPRKAWTVDDLARAVGVSRSVLASRFTELVGQPPMQYLALWRMQLASHLLGNGHSVAEAAQGVGYESEAAFSRAFKKLMGDAPGAWRRRGVMRRGEPSADAAVDKPGSPEFVEA